MVHLSLWSTEGRHAAHRWVFDRAAKGLGMYFHADVILDHASLTWFGVESSDLPRLAVVKVAAACLSRACRVGAASLLRP